MALKVGGDALELQSGLWEVLCHLRIESWKGMVRMGSIPIEWEYHGNIEEYHRNIMGISCKYKGNIRGIVWEYQGNIGGISGEYHRNIMGI